MISEHQFSTQYSSAWRSVAPLSDGFWAVENRQVERIDAPLRALAPKGLRAIINETAFRAFCDLHSKARSTGDDGLNAAVQANVPAAIAYVGRFSNAPTVEPSDFDASCCDEARALLVRLLRYFPARVATVLRPHFNGCGLLSACEGDLIAGKCLYEVKAGERAFRLMDLRQLLTYAALAYASRSLTFTQIGLLNPRTGVAWKRTLDDVCRSISGQPPSDTLSALVEQFSVASASR